MQALLLSLFAALLFGCYNALDIKLPPTMTGSDSASPAGSAMMGYGTETMMMFNKRARCSSCPSFGCCPTIVTYPPKASSVIEPVNGYRGNVALIVDWGPRYPWGRACTTGDHGFVVFVNWGDGTGTIDHLDDFGPWQSKPLHQYDKSNRTYGILVYYCSNPSPGWPSQRCCDSMYRTIDVREL